MTFGYITQQASKVTDRPRQRVAVESTRTRSNGARRALGVTLVTIGQRMAGELPAAPTVHSDCA